MKLSKQTFTMAGALALAVLILPFVAPKTVHAIAATLVQVTNTSSNPVITQPISQQASQMVELYCLALGTTQCTLVGSSAPYTVPANQSLVINAIDVLPYPNCTLKERYDYLVEGNLDVQDLTLLTMSISPTVSTHMSYPSGFVIKTGQPLSVNGDCKDLVYLTGYLTPN